MYADGLAVSPYGSTMDFGERVLAAMRARGYKTNKAFALAAGITPQYVTNITRYGAVPTDDVKRAIAKALSIDTGALLSDDDHVFLAALEGEDRASTPSGIERSHVIQNQFTAGGKVKGPLGMLGATGPAAGLHKALTNELRRRGPGKTKTVSLAGVPQGMQLIELAVPLEVWIDGAIVERFSAGRLLIVDTEAEPQTREVELVVATRDPDPFAAPSPDNPEPEQGDTMLMRYEPGPRGTKLLFPLTSNEAVTTTQGWRIVGVVVDDRPAPRSPA